MSGFPKEQLEMYLNDALKFVRRTILIERPELVEQRESLTVTDKKIILSKAFVKVIRILDKDKNVIPSSTYELRLPKTIDFEDPNLKLEDGTILTVEYIPEFENVTGAETDYPLPSDFSQAIVEYTTIRAQLRNEFNMSQETSLFSDIHEQIVLILRSMRSDSQRVKGYWRY